MENKNLILYCFILLSFFGNSQEVLRNHWATRTSDEPTIDGRLTDKAWSDADGNWSSDFVQRLPNEGAQPSKQTYFKILYDDTFLYVGVQCKDEVENINRWMSRRDGYNGDWVEIILDTYHDKRTAFSFTLSSAGVKSDKYITLNGAEEDMAWNPIWYAQSALYAEGWTAEMKIPLSQLRFSKEEIQTWRLQVQRRILRNEELSLWQRVPQDAPGWVSEFGIVKGINGIKPQKQLELQPFIVGTLETFEKIPDNPFQNSNKQALNFGLDGKVGITNDITLDFTINPDFGQVEADPSAIALDGFQLFFQEQRPFFIENKNIFDYRFSSPIIGGPYSSDNLFYSRRIGRQPQGSVSLNEGEFADIPQRTAILGAIKLSGKTRKGLSFGVLESFTPKVTAEISDGSSQLTEPQTNYFMARVLQDLNNRKTFIGGIFTSVIRAEQPETSFLHKSAKTGGLDFLHQWQDRNWYVGANLVMSHVNGSKEAIRRTQLSIPHLFQRGAGHIALDSTRTSLTGTGGDIKLGKAGSGNIQGELGVTWRSPELDLNDIGFLREADLFQHYTGISYRSINSFGIFRNAKATYQHWLNWDFEGKLNYVDWDVSAEATFQNNWSSAFGYFSQPHIFSKSLLQGGPRIKLTDQHGFWWALNTDSRRKFFITYSGWTKTGGEGSYYLLENTLGINYQPLDRLRISVTPKLTQIKHRLQYNETLINGMDNQYVVSLLDQNTLSLVVRADVTIGPNISLQYYAEPFISQGKYNRFALVENPLQSFTEEQLNPLDIINTASSGTKLEVDMDSDGVGDAFIRNSDFSFAQFRSNLVYRWEYRPGSELFLVWSQNFNDTALPENGLVSSLREQIFSQNLGSTFLIKLTYRFHR
ncbi:carbohydrate binding family 9 domain-containing protein [Flagellimonas hymeniacidonis]|uniref:Carbohydrate binding family 9 domain-containing protein n=1 Tax=Flagellimonas hymeniacidonis TaxID=2603628 RepID=A0A5C8V2B2_9FLAO|nr:DUF5916 domain-containing protein [Flagellimonas hymeniacidonis]TXN35222.1 carbohydrate binding family 9 domain-containing protein [Flagellimonas hymeniacidonis]